MNRGAAPAAAPARRRSALGVLWRTARSLPTVVADSAGGRYRGPGRLRLAGAAAGLAYLVSPVDLLPEAVLPLLGLLDDGVVAAWVAGSLLSATEDHAAWRERRGGARGPVHPVHPLR